MDWELFTFSMIQQSGFFLDSTQRVSDLMLQGREQCKTYQRKIIEKVLDAKCWKKFIHLFWQFDACSFGKCWERNLPSLIQNLARNIISYSIIHFNNFLLLAIEFVQAYAEFWRMWVAWCGSLVRPALSASNSLLRLSSRPYLKSATITIYVGTWAPYQPGSAASLSLPREREEGAGGGRKVER